MGLLVQLKLWPACLHFLFPKLQPKPAWRLFFSDMQKPHGSVCICIPALSSCLLPPSIRSCIPASPQPASPCQPQALPLHFQSRSKPRWSQQKIFYCLPGPLDQLCSSSWKLTLYIKLFFVLVSVASHVPQVNYPSFSSATSLQCFVLLVFCVSVEGCNQMAALAPFRVFG